jgi:hypothetical protein
MHEVQSNGATSPVVVDLTQDNNGNEGINNFILSNTKNNYFI